MLLPGATRFALAPGFLMPRLWRYLASIIFTPLALPLGPQRRNQTSYTRNDEQFPDSHSTLGILVAVAGTRLISRENLPQRRKDAKEEADVNRAGRDLILERLVEVLLIEALRYLHDHGNLVSLVKTHAQNPGPVRADNPTNAVHLDVGDEVVASGLERTVRLLR